jgi:hypothetical protein
MMINIENESQEHKPPQLFMDPMDIAKEYALKFTFDPEKVNEKKEKVSEAEQEKDHRLDVIKDMCHYASIEL